MNITIDIITNKTDIEIAKALRVFAKAELNSGIRLVKLKVKIEPLPLSRTSFRKQRTESQQLFDEATEICSEVNRRKGVDYKGIACCITCGKPYRWQEMDAGHFLAKGSYPHIAFHPLNLWPQCKRCNVFKKNDPLIADAYERAMKLKSRELGFGVGDGIKERLLSLNKTNYQSKKSRYEAAIFYYKPKLKELN